MQTQNTAVHAEDISSLDDITISKTSSYSLDDIITPHTLAKEYPDLFTNGGIDWNMRQREYNGLDEAGAVLKVGRKLYLRRSKFIEWFLRQKA